MKMQILNQFFAKRFTILLLYVCQVFINLQDHLNFFLHFVFSFMGQLFMDDPISLSQLLLAYICKMHINRIMVSTTRRQISSDSTSDERNSF